MPIINAKNSSKTKHPTAGGKLTQNEHVSTPPIQQKAKQQHHQQPLSKKKLKIWMDKTIPANINEIYDSCSCRLDEVKKDLDNIDNANFFDTENLFDSLNFYSIHLHDLKDFMGVSEIKSLKTMKHIRDVVKAKIKTQNEIFLKEKENKKAKLLPDLYEKHKVDEFDEEFIQIEQDILKQESKKTSVESENKLPSINGNSDQPLPVKYERVPVTEDPVITPILIAHRNRQLFVNQVTEDNTDILSELIDKIQEGINDKYRTPIEEINGIAKIFEKYLLSFLLANSQNFLESKVKNDETELDTYNRNLIRTDILLEAPIKYDKKRLYYVNFIRQSINSLISLKAKFDDGTYNGITLDDLSHENKTLARRFDLKSLPVVLILPEYSVVLNKCVKILNEWLIYDKEYSDFIETDTKDIEKRKKNLNAIKHGSEVLFNDITHKIKLAKNLLELHEQEINETCKKNEVKMYWLKTESTKIFQPKLKLNPDYEHLDCRNMLERLNIDFGKLEAEIPKLNCHIDKNTFKNKQMIMEDKYRQFDALRSKIINMENQMIYFYEEKKVKQNELDILENCHLKLKTILMYKDSSETLNKIFFDLPLPATKFALTDDKSIELLKMNIDLDEEAIKKNAVVSKDGTISNNYKK
jgi:hypothetical protein